MSWECISRKQHGIETTNKYTNPNQSNQKQPA